MDFVDRPGVSVRGTLTAKVLVTLAKAETFSSDSNGPVLLIVTL